MSLLITTVVMFQAQNKRNYKQYLKSCCDLQNRYEDECDKNMFHNTTPDLPDQDHSVQDQDKD